MCVGSSTFLLADIGGTNARFTMIDAETHAQIATQIYQVRENPTLSGTLQKFRDSHCGGYDITAVALAIAGPVLDDVVKLTNSDWICDKAEIIRLMGTEKVFILNDFEAIAWAILSLAPQDVCQLQTGQISQRHPAIVLGPGTGLGVAALARQTDGSPRAFTTESGHTRYAPANDREHKMIRFLARTYNFVSAEHLISGPGLVNLYRANCHLANKVFEPCEPAAIVERARQGDTLCRQVLDDFSAIFGSVASQLALSWNALGGVYLTGGVLQKMGGDFDKDRFLERFDTNPKMADLLQRIPITRVQTDIPAFTGLTAMLKTTLMPQSPQKKVVGFSF